jgi:hypothetical protein
MQNEMEMRVSPPEYNNDVSTVEKVLTKKVANGDDGINVERHNSKTTEEWVPTTRNRFQCRRPSSQRQ